MVEKIKNKLRGNGFLLAVTIVLFFVLYIAGAILYGDRNFTSPQVFLNLFISNAGLIIAAVGMTFVLITGGIDIFDRFRHRCCLYDACMDDGSEAYERSCCNYSGISIWCDFRIGSRIFSSLFKNTAIHRNTWRNVLCQRSYSIDQFRYDQY